MAGVFARPWRVGSIHSNKRHKLGILTAQPGKSNAAKDGLNAGELLGHNI